MEFQWIRLGLAAKWDKAVQPALRLATVQAAFSWSSWSQLLLCFCSWLFHILYHIHHHDYICFPQGRMKFVRPLYRDLYVWEEKRQQAIDTFKAHRWSTYNWSYKPKSMFDHLHIFVLIALLFLGVIFVWLCLKVSWTCKCQVTIQKRFSPRSQYMAMCADMVAKDLHLE